MKNLANLRLAAALLAIASFGFTGCAKEEGIMPQQSAETRDLRADAGVANNRQGPADPLDIRSQKDIHDQGALDFTPAHRGDLDADDFVMFQIDKSALAGQPAYSLMISKKGIVRFIGKHDTKVPHAELRIGATQQNEIDRIFKSKHSGPFNLNDKKAAQDEVCYILTRAGGSVVKTAMASSSRELRELEAEVLGALGIDKLIYGDTIGILHD